MKGYKWGFFRVSLQDEFDEEFKDKRFQVKEYPNVISTGCFYVVKDTLDVMMDISFDSDWDEAEEFCTFINNLNNSDNVFRRFYDCYEKFLVMLEDKYCDVDEVKHDVLLELDTLINKEME